jgi:hypothetical protein
MPKKTATIGQKTVPPGYKNYGQYRSEQVHARNALRKTPSEVYSRPKKQKRRFKANQSVDNSTYNRTLNRLDALDKIPKGLADDKITGADARRVKRALRKQRDKKLKYTGRPYQRGL